MNHNKKKVDGFNSVKEIIKARRAIRSYVKKKIPDSLIKEVTKTALMAPSSYGLEPWYLIIIENNKIKEEVYQCFDKNNKQILTASHLFIVLSWDGRIFNNNNVLFWKHLQKTGIIVEENTDIMFEKRLAIGSKFMELFDYKKPFIISRWAKNQAFILLQNFLLLFTSLNIATCPMGGVNETKLIDYLENNKIIEKNLYKFAISFVAGYSEKINIIKNIRKSKMSKYKIV